MGAGALKKRFHRGWSGFGRDATGTGMETAFDRILSVAKTSKFDIKKPKRVIQRKAPLVDPRKASAPPSVNKAHFAYDDEHADRYLLVNGQLCFRRSGVLIPGVTGCDAWDSKGNLLRNG